MLKALELHGFKSFADRTRFEFPAGITAVVGPNGSGKSNIVDAIKWVLGTQSAKALRGKEMTDVIFSGASHRRQTNSAEVTLVFDNRNGQLEYDGEEVHLTRRVYRSGEAEYLINRETCRLRDIRDIFAGAGVSSSPYSIIEQGRVDALLQSSPRERRLIFEEAAGVSRFKLKRQEADRRLERVEQNLVRLSDIVDQLESRLKTVRSQAGRARNYKQQSDRLKQLRIQVALVDWREFSAKLRTMEQEIDTLREVNSQIQQSVAANDRQLGEWEQAANQLQQQLQDHAQDQATIREKIAQYESDRRSHLARHDELTQESQRLARQLLTLSSRAGSAQQLVTETATALDEAERHFQTLQETTDARAAELESTRANLAQLRQQMADSREAHAAGMKKCAELEKHLHLFESQRDAARARIDEAREKLEQSAAAKESIEHQFLQAENELKQVQQSHHTVHTQLENTEAQLTADRQSLEHAQQQQGELASRLTAARERAVVLDELESRLDGLSAGTKQVLRLAQEEPDGPFGSVRGVVADLLNVDADTASLVEIALGERANHLLIEKLDQQWFTSEEYSWAGRTSFLRLDVPFLASAVDRIDLSAEAGVMGRADQFVQAAPDLQKLTRHLLGRFWFVDTLATALRLAGGIGRGLNYVTVAGELLSADGTLIVGPRHSTTGLLSRRSELRALTDELSQLQEKIDQQRAQCSKWEDAIRTKSIEREQLSIRDKQLSQQLSEVRVQATTLGERLARVRQDWQQQQSAFDEIRTSAATAERQMETAQTTLQQEKEEIHALESSLQQQSEASHREEEQLASVQRELTDHRVELARSEQRRDGLRSQMEQLQRDHLEHDRALAETRQRASQCQQQRQQLNDSVLALTSELAELYHAKEQFAAEAVRFRRQLDDIRQSRQTVLGSLDRERQKLLHSQSALQNAEQQQQQHKHTRDELATRMQEDYDLELALMAKTEPAVEIASRKAIDDEIITLRHQLQTLGPVNLEALSELEAIEERHSTLAGQYQDLREAKVRLQQLVAKINNESREMFVETLETIRGHFQELYTNLFGGGEADILIDDSQSPDVLECGIEIIARPPGKQPRSISLLSGGERTLTCVALLLAIFRSRPSPFCVLDEVDAALDEANIDRFVEVLKEFMATTQFLVVTHSKRTMSCADTLYGITMQESGVSKRVSVRFENLSEAGQKRTAA